MTPTRALISTIEPVDGGVPTMARLITRLLEEEGIEPVFAWYAPWSSYPKLSVPLPGLARGRRPSRMRAEAYGGHEGHGFGAWLPELEFTHYLPRRGWRELIASCDLHLAVTGNSFCASPFARLGLPFLAWVATPWEADRVNRVRQFSAPRRLLDRQFNSRVLRRLERQVLRAPRGRILALSSYTARSLGAIAGRAMDGVLRMPIDPTLFHRLPGLERPWHVGFSGRWTDPRKNIELLLAAVAHLVQQGRPVQLELIGEAETAELRERIQGLGMGDRVHCHAHLQPTELASVLQRLDLFVVPSHQEGLCIAALEAMACGVPVVSTRCGGPEDYVLTDRTGQLVNAEPEAMAAAIDAICGNRPRRQRLGAGASGWVKSHASLEGARSTFRHHLAALRTPSAGDN